MDIEKVKSFTKGVCAFSEKPDGFFMPERMTAPQSAYFEAMNSAMAMRAHCSAGVRFDFVTDEKELSFDYRIPESYRTEVAFDVYENDVLYSSVMNTTGQDGRFVYRVLTEGKVRITIHFPCIAMVTFRNVSFDNAEPHRDPENMKKILFFGDSITQGVDCGRNASLNFPALTARYLNTEFVNLGVGSAMFCPEFIDAGHPFVPDEIVVAYGANDGVTKNRTDAEVESKTAEFMKKIKSTYPGAAIYALSPVWSWRNDENGSKPYTPEEKLRQQLVRDVIIKFSAENGIAFIDGMKLVPHMQEFFRPNDPHPVEIGFSLFAAELSKKIAALRKA